MKFICENSSCAIATSKATFPAAMACPVCSIALIELIESIELSEEDETLIMSLPYVIAYPLKRTLLEKHPWSKINLFKDTFLNYLKYLGLLSASEFFNSPLKDKRMVALFQQSIAEPSFGTWNLFVRETLKYLNENHHIFFCPELNSYYEAIETSKKRKLFNGEIEFIDANGDVQLKKQEATAIGMLINFRNRYLGHGLTLDENSSLKLWNEYFPVFRNILEQMTFASKYTMRKHEHGETYLLQTADIQLYETTEVPSESVWIKSPNGNTLNILPFYVVPGELSLDKEDKEQILAYESYTGKTIKFFSPEGTEMQSSGKILEKLNLLLRDKQKETPYGLETLTKEVFKSRIDEENKLLNDTLVAEKKVITGIYVNREDTEVKLREWIGSLSSIFFIAAEAGSGKTNLLVEIQKQYSERNLPSLIVRAGRMEKQTLKQQIAYLLNIDYTLGLENFKNIAGTQAEPNFILIDGLNEAYDSENIWIEILEISKIYEPGSLKFVVSSRANSKADLERYTLTETDYQNIYGEKNENEDGLSAFANWLNPLDMKELSLAWDLYIQKDKTRFKPMFSFDDIALFDRGLYNEINNPLVLRIFLEIYNKKHLPKKHKQILNIWKDWLETFSDDEQIFLNLLANEIWIKGENELFIDELFQNESLKMYLRSDNINSAYPRLKNLGWISRYTKDLNTCIGFTVEGALLFLLGRKLLREDSQMDLNFINKILKGGNKLKKGAIESYLCENAQSNQILKITELIDSGVQGINLCIKPLRLYLKNFGGKALIENVLENATQNDWIALSKLDIQLNELQLHILRKEFLIELMPFNKFNNKEALSIGLKTISILNKKEALTFSSKMDINQNFIQENADLLFQLGRSENKFGNYDKALELHEKSLDIKLKNLGHLNSSVAQSLNNIGNLWEHKNNYIKAIDYIKESLEIKLKIFKPDHPSLATSYNNLGIIYFRKGDYDKSIEYHQKSLDNKLKNIGKEHLNVANSYNNIGVVLKSKGEINNALAFYQKSLAIKLKTLGEEHPSVAATYNSIGNAYKSNNEYDRALEYHQKSLEIKLKTLGYEHVSVAKSYNNIGNIYEVKNELDQAIEYHHKSLAIKINTFGEKHLLVATSYNNLGNTLISKGEFQKALDYCQKSLEIRLEIHGNVHPEIANSLVNIGLAHYNLSECNLATDCYEKAIIVFLETLGADHMGTANAYFGSAKNQMASKQYNTAITQFEQCYSINKKALSLYHIGQAYESLHQKELALKYYLQFTEQGKDDASIEREIKAAFEIIQNQN